MKKNIIFSFCVLSLILCSCSNNNSWSSENLGDIKIEESSISEVDVSLSESEIETEESSEIENIKEPINTDNYFYYMQLNNDEKMVYDRIVEACNNLESKVDISGIDSDTLYKSLYAVYYDYPEYYWTSSYTTYSLGGALVSIEFIIPETIQSDLEQIESEELKIINQIPETYTDYEKAKYLYEYIIDTTDYVPDSEDNQNLKSVLINGQSVCAGYSRTFQYLCNKIGINCTYVTGETIEGESHGWNLVCLNNNYYWVDVTWGDPVFNEENENFNNLNYDYFFVNDTELFRSHILKTGIKTTNYEKDNVFSYPECTDNSLNYFYLNNCYFETFDQNEIYNYISDKIKDKEYEFSLKFNNIDDYNNCYNYLFYKETEDSVLGIFDIALNSYGESFQTLNYNYSYNDEIYLLEIKLTFS